MQRNKLEEIISGTLLGELRLSQNQLARNVRIRRENIRDVELMKRCFSVKNFRKILKSLSLDVAYLLKELKVGG
ncbi:MAG: hypothetical protein QXQ18_02695 [Candidatus Aenigmatarchaeota archaeon]